MEYDSSSINLLRPSIVFVPNRGQAAGSARFTARTPGQDLYFHEDGLTAVLFSSERNTQDQQATIKGTVVKIAFLGASHAILQALHPAAGQFHYFTGNDPSNWRTHIPSYEQLRYANLWGGVDLTLAGEKEGLKFLWSLSHPSRVSSIRIRYEGAEEIRIKEDGSLVIRHALGELIDPAPVAWQEIGGKKKPVECAYVVNGDTVSFAISGAYAATAPLFIDPVLPYSTFLGGSMADSANAICVDSAGCAYVAGYTYSTNFPVTPGAFQTAFAGEEMAFLTKLAADGRTLVYSTFLGRGTTEGNGVAVDENHCAYITGYTNSGSFPVTPGAFQTVFGGAYDAFVTKVSADGARLIYSTFLGGIDTEFGMAVAVDSQGCAYATGITLSGNFPVTPGAYQTALRGGIDAYIAKLSPTGASLVYSTYFGGNDVVWADAVAIDAQGCAYITGETTSINMPVTPGAFQRVYGGGSSDAFVTKLAADGSALVYSTYLGGSEYDGGNGIAVDAQNIAHVAGGTSSFNFPVTPGAFQTVYSGGFNDSFITKLAPDGGSLVGSTFLGGNGSDIAKCVALDQHGNVYTAGSTNSSNFPVTPQVIPSYFHGFLDAYVSILSPDLSRLPVSLYIGGSSSTNGLGIALGANGAVYVTGSTSSPDFPVTPGAFQTVNAGGADAFVVKDGFALIEKASLTVQGML